jgi:arylsulfatase A-like enzyme
VLSDHGEGLMQRGRMGHSFSLNQELTHALWILHGPELGLAPRDVQVNVSLVDVVPTLLELLGLPAASGREGHSVAALARPAADTEASARLAQRPLFGHRSGARFRQNRGRALWSVAQGPWKLIEDTGRGELALYDLESDPAELRDLAAERPEVAQRLAAQLAEYRSRAQPVEEVPVRIEIDPELAEELRVLGYTDDEEHE